MTHVNLDKLWSYDCLIPFQMADPAGILFFGNAFSLFHLAFEHFIQERMECSWPFWFQNPEWIVPIKHAQADYIKPIVAGSMCQIDIVIAAVTHSSFTLTSTLQQIHLCCSIETVHIFCSRPAMQKMAIPSPLRARLNQFLL
jgi:acyl-CoA thioester hydrolase/1,4-dihydroxy-2-naphthoyl-CoA hydrolase